MSAKNLNNLKFAALDFETADEKRDSACSLAIVRVEAGKIVARDCQLIRPPRSNIVFEHIHGLNWSQLQRHPCFADVWRQMRPMVKGVDFLAAHNAAFDSSVLRVCCSAHELKEPPFPWVCTVQLARKVWGLYPTKLPNVCEHLGIRLNHHQALSDAEACAKIVIALQQSDSCEITDTIRASTKLRERTLGTP